VEVVTCEARSRATWAEFRHTTSGHPDSSKEGAQDLNVDESRVRVTHHEFS
jgi:hypothetical protein